MNTVNKTHSFKPYPMYRAHLFGIYVAIGSLLQAIAVCLMIVRGEVNFEQQSLANLTFGVMVLTALVCGVAILLALIRYKKKSHLSFYLSNRWDKEGIYLCDKNKQIGFWKWEDLKFVLLNTTKETGYFPGYRLTLTFGDSVDSRCSLRVYHHQEYIQLLALLLQQSPKLQELMADKLSRNHQLVDLDEQGDHVLIYSEALKLMRSNEEIPPSFTGKGKGILGILCSRSGMIVTFIIVTIWILKIICLDLF